MQTSMLRHPLVRDDRGALVEMVRVSGYPRAKIARLHKWDIPTVQRLIREATSGPDLPTEHDRLLRENNDLRRALKLSIEALTTGTEV